VELNTIASSFACLSTLTGRMHRHLIGRAAAASDRARAAAEALAARLPENRAMEEIAAAMAAAVDAAGGGVVVMVVRGRGKNAWLHPKQARELRGAPSLCITQASKLPNPDLN
jgi:glutathione synthase